MFSSKLRPNFTLARDPSLPCCLGRRWSSIFRPKNAGEEKFPRRHRQERNLALWGAARNYLTYILTYLTKLLTAWGRVLEKLTGRQLVEKFPAFYGTRRLITALQVPASCPSPERNYLALLVILSAGWALMQAVRFCTKQSGVDEYSEVLGISVCPNAFEFERLCVYYYYYYYY
jgi:hypothetical protein